MNDPATIGEEVDFVVEVRQCLLPIEVKATARPRLRDVSNLRTLRAEYGKRASAGLLLHNGDMLDWIAPDVLAAPWWRMIDWAIPRNPSSVTRLPDC